MAKLTLSFKERLISVHHMDERPMTIGRERGCGIRIDSLAWAPRHAELMPTEAGVLLLALDPGFPVLLNNEQVDQATLHHGDLIQIGKHTLIFSEGTLDLTPPQAPVDATQGRPGDGSIPKVIPAYVQVQSGPQIGRVIALRRAVTRLNLTGTDDLIVIRQANTYLLSRLGGPATVEVDGSRMRSGAELALSSKSVIQIDDVRLQFFTGQGDEVAETANRHPGNGS